MRFDCHWATELHASFYSRIDCRLAELAAVEAIPDCATQTNSTRSGAHRAPYRGQNWTPIRGQSCAPIEGRDRERTAVAHSCSFRRISGNRLPSHNVPLPRYATISNQAEVPRRQSARLAKESGLVVSRPATLWQLCSFFMAATFRPADTKREIPFIKKKLAIGLVLSSQRCGNK